MRIRVTRDDGFTLLEIAAVVLILGILVSISVASYSIAANRSRRITCSAQRRVIIGAIGQYQEAHADAYPADLAELSPYIGSRGDYRRCPEGSSEYLYDPMNGNITCPVHTSP